LHAERDFGSNAYAFPAIDVHRKRGHASLAHGFDLGLDHALDVLRVEVVPAHDDQVLDAARHMDLPAVHEAQVARAQPAPACMLDKGLLRLLRLAPVALADAGAVRPDLAHAAGLQHLQAVRIDDGHGMAGNGGAAAHQRGGLRGAGAFGPALAQGLGIEGRDRGARAATAAGDEQGGFGQAVAGIGRVGRRPQAAKRWAKAVTVSARTGSAPV
jgi:hypothetical protein